MIELKAWHIENLIEIEPDAQVVILEDAQKEIQRLQGEVENAKVNSEYWLKHFNELRKQFDEMQQRAEAAERERDEFHAMAVYAGGIMEESTGVAGWHINGDIAEWDELFTTDLYREAIAKRDTEQQRKALEDFFSDWPEDESSKYEAWEIIESAKIKIEQLRNKEGE